jgi:hypothetical protein
VVIMRDMRSKLKCLEEDWRQGNLVDKRGAGGCHCECQRRLYFVSKTLQRGES